LRPESGYGTSRELLRFSNCDFPQLDEETPMRGSLPVSSVGGGSRVGLEGRFSQFSAAIARLSGKPVTFALATLIVLTWAVTGPIFHYSDTWQLVINTGTTIVTFLMVFLIQNTQNRDTLALQVKLDELLLATKKARNDLVGVEDSVEADLEKLRDDEKKRAAVA
jgi:low affinity Fe/Cu permease